MVMATERQVTVRTTTERAFNRMIVLADRPETRTHRGPGARPVRALVGLTFSKALRTAVTVEQRCNGLT